MGYKGISIAEKKKRLKEEQSNAIEKVFFGGNVIFTDYIQKFSTSFDTRFKVLLKQIEKLNKK